MLTPKLEVSTPLLNAIVSGDLRLIDLELDIDPNINTPGYNFCADVLTPLTEAVELRLASVVSQLLMLGANPDDSRVRFSVIETPLMIAVKNSFHEIAEILLRRADPDLASVTVLGINQKIIETPLHFAARLGDIQMVKLLVDSGATVDMYSITNHGPTALYNAISAGNFHVACFLISAGADLNIRVFDPFTRRFSTPFEILKR